MSQNPPVETQKKSPFSKATKQSAKAKIALTGPSGSGKTLSSLLIAKGLGGRCCVIDTENGSASLYAGHRLLDGFEYDVATIEPSYDLKKYLILIEEAHKAKYDVLIIDSLTHAWAGEGGLLQKKEALDSRGGNSYTNWGAITKEYERLKSYLLHSKMDLIVTMRSKQEYVLEDNGKGKQAPKKVGLAPIMRDGMEYEFTVVFDIGMDHQFMVSKDRTDLFDGVVATISEDTGAQIKEWLRGEPSPPSDPLPDQEHPPVDAQEMPKTELESQEAPPDEATITVKLPGCPIHGKRIGECPEPELKQALKWLDKELENKSHPKNWAVRLLTAKGQITQFLKSVGAL